MADHNIVLFPMRGYPEIGFTVPRFSDDIMGLISNREDVEAILSDAQITSDKKVIIAKAYDRRLEMLHLEWKDAIDGNIFKAIEGSQYPLYRIVVTKRPINLRVIFAFFILNNTEVAILLHAFKESNKADYRGAIVRAENRAEALISSGCLRWSQ